MMQSYRAKRRQPGRDNVDLGSFADAMFAKKWM